MKLFIPVAAALAVASAGQVYQQAAQAYEPAQGYSHTNQAYSQSAQAYSQPAQAYSQPAQHYNHAAQAYSQAQPVQTQAHIIYSQESSQIPQEHYSNNAEVYQSGLEHGFTGQAHGRALGEKAARILSYEYEDNGHNYQYQYETENGIKVQEAGQTGKGTQAHGSFSYTGDDGHVYAVSYTADENGFRAQGAHIPTPPPVPEAILKALEQNARDEAAGIFDDGKYNAEHHSAQTQQTVQNYQYGGATAYQQDNSIGVHGAQAQATSGGDNGYYHH